MLELRMGRANHQIEYKQFELEIVTVDLAGHALTAFTPYTRAQGSPRNEKPKLNMFDPPRHREREVVWCTEFRTRPRFAKIHQYQHLVRTSISIERSRRSRQAHFP